MKKNILITGGAGFIGSWLCKALLERGHFVVSIDDLSGATQDRVNALSETYAKEGDKEFQFRFHFGSCLHRDWVRSIIRAYSIDTVVHCAANARESASQFQPFTIAQRNLSAYSSVLSAAIEASVKSVVCFSSLAVYGEGTQEPPFKESQLPAPEDVYGINKYAMEMITRVLCPLHGLNYAIVRPHNVFGEHQELRDPFRNVAGIFMNRIMRREPLVLFNNGKNVRCFSYIRDALPPMIELAENTEAYNGLVVNIGGMTHITVQELAAHTITCMGENPMEYPVTFAPARPCEVARAYTDHGVQCDVLKYEEKYGWENGIARMSAWARERGPQGWRMFDSIEINSPLIPPAWRDMLPAIAEKSPHK